MLVKRGFESSREKAKTLIEEGKVFINNKAAEKPAQECEDDAVIEIRGDKPRYVSRGGLKLEKALNVFGIALSDKICMDIGASTGGFTDCMLRNGAAKVYAVDAGSGQLATKLKEENRVINLENINIRYLTSEQVTEKAEFTAVDVSFISLTYVLPVVKEFIKDDGEAVCLIKPQFEAGKGGVGKNGVVRKPEIHIQVINKIISSAIQLGFAVTGADYSPIKGPEGNIEYLLYIKNALNYINPDINIKRLVEEAHKKL